MKDSILDSCLLTVGSGSTETFPPFSLLRWRVSGQKSAAAFRRCLESETQFFKLDVQTRENPLDFFPLVKETRPRVKRRRCQKISAPGVSAWNEAAALRNKQQETQQQQQHQHNNNNNTTAAAQSRKHQQTLLPDDPFTHWGNWSVVIGRRWRRNEGEHTPGSVIPLHANRNSTK